MIRKDENDEGFGEPKTEVKAPAKKTLAEKIGDKITEWKDSGCEIDGFAISPATAKLLRERPGSEYVGTTFTRLCRTVKDGVAGPWTPFRTGLVATEEKVIVQEFSIVPDGLNGYSEIFCSMNGREAIVIGHRISVDVLKRMQSNNALSEAGLKMLNEQSGEESAAEVSTTK